MPKDTTVATRNAYTELFPDSLAMETFLTADAVTDTLRQRIRNFYNRCNLPLPDLLKMAL